MRTRTGILLALLCSFLSVGVHAQKVTISGYVKDAASGEPLIGAAVLYNGTKIGTVTGTSGFYSLSFEAGDAELLFTCLGYTDKVVKRSVKQNLVMDVLLDESSTMLEGAVVTAHQSVTGVRGTQMSAVEVPINQIKTMPAVGGEVDVIKTLQLLPGVQSGTEGTAGMYVRGGGADENLLMLDGVPLYNVNHLMGFFSVFNADALKNVTLYKGSFPARFGGHLSSVIDVRMNDGNESEYHGNASVGLIAAKFNLEGPIVKGRTTFNVSARRTYMDLLTIPLMAYLNRDNKVDADNYSKVSGGYDFYDLNAKITHRFKNNDRLSLCFYSGDDQARIALSSANSDTQDGFTFKSKDVMGMNWDWGNLVSSLRWNHTVGPMMFMTASASYTRYRSALGISLENGYDSYYNKHLLAQSSTSVGMNYNSLVNDVSACVDFDWHPSYRHDIKFGAGYTFHIFKPGIVSFSQKVEESNSEPESMEQKIGNDPLYSHEAAAYFEDNMTITDYLKLNLGLRTSLYTVGKPYFSVEPRLSIRALATDNLSFKASYSEMSQYIHLLCNSNLSLPSDLWVPVTKNILPMRSRQAAAGAFYELGQFEFSLEGYYKTMDNVLEYRDGASYMGVSSGWEEKVCMGKGWSYGMEFLIQKKVGNTTGWIGYTLAKAMRRFDREGMIINDGNPFPAKYDRRHDLSVVVSHKFNKHFDLSATFVYSSGNCGSLAIDEFNPGDGYGDVGYIPYRNNYRMPPYHRMDLGMNFYKFHRKGQSIWNISVYNLYNYKNPFIVLQDYNYRFDPDRGEFVSYRTLKKISIFPIIPTVSYTYKF